MGNFGCTKHALWVGCKKLTGIFKNLRSDFVVNVLRTKQYIHRFVLLTLFPYGKSQLLPVWHSYQQKMGHHNMLLPVGHQQKKERTIFDNSVTFFTPRPMGNLISRQGNNVNSTNMQIFNCPQDINHDKQKCTLTIRCNLNCTPTQFSIFNSQLLPLSLPAFFLNFIDDV